MRRVSERDVPPGVTVTWSEALAAEAYRVAAPRRVSALTVRPGRRALAVAGTAGVGGATGAAMLFEYGLSHARGLMTLMGISLAVIAGVLLDRLAPRFMNRTELRFTDDAMEAIADMALERKIGARGLRMIIEDLMLELMYTLPGQKKGREYVVTREMVITKNTGLEVIEKAG